MKKKIARAAFPGKHRLVFEILAEQSENGYWKDVVFAEIHENNYAENIIRMQLNAFGLFKFCRGIEEIIPLGEKLLTQESGSTAPKKVQGDLRLFTQSQVGQTALFFGAKCLPGNGGKEKIWYYINMYRNGTTYAIKFNKAEILAVKDQTYELAIYAYSKFMELQAGGGSSQHKAERGDRL